MHRLRSGERCDLPIARVRREAQNTSTHMDKPDLAMAPARDWTRIDAYFGALARRRTARRAAMAPARTEPEGAHFLLSTLPFAALIGVLGLLIVAFAVAAFPGSQPVFEPARASVAHEAGTAPKGWFDEAKKEFR